jgi:hypothetical protein
MNNALPEELDLWAYRSLPIKNTLTAADARLIEEAFQAKLLALAGSQSVASAPEAAPALQTDPVHTPAASHAPDNPEATVSDKNRRRGVMPKLRRVRDKGHRAFVAKQPCVVCAKQPCDAHHVRFAQGRGLGLKVSDEFTVPLCRAHHRELHRRGREETFWAELKIEPLAIAERLWRQTRNERQDIEIATQPTSGCPASTDSDARYLAKPVDDKTNPVTAGSR